MTDHLRICPSSSVMIYMSKINFLNLIALRKKKKLHSFGLSECDRVNPIALRMIKYPFDCSECKRVNLWFGFHSSYLKIFLFFYFHRDRNIPWENCIGYSSDNASVMTGRSNSVLSRLREKNPAVFNLGCVCHLANLCAQAGIKALPLPVEDLLVDVYFHFYHR